jgi:hypothetical protein
VIKVRVKSLFAAPSPKTALVAAVAIAVNRKSVAVTGLALSPALDVVVVKVVVIEIVHEEILLRMHH